MTAREADEQVRIWRAAELEGAELLRGRFRHLSYPPHAHATVGLALITGGAIEIAVGGNRRVAGKGTLVLLNAEEVHAGWPAGPEGWKMRTLHLAPAALLRVAQELTGRSRANAALRGPTAQDTALARSFFELHWCSEMQGSALERQSRLVFLLAGLLANHAEQPRLAPPVVSEPAAVARVRRYLEETLTEKVTLEDLAAVAGLPPFRLLRAFTRAVGLPPHGYRMQTRVRRAADLLRQRRPIAEVAAITGFADQAHLTRVFKRIIGVTPGRFRDAASH